jgi:DNA-binding response OmpR family regulator
LTFGRLRIDITGRQLYIDGEHIELTGREWLILECLALNSGHIVTKERLQQAVAGWDQATTPNAIEVHVSRVRAKLGESVVLRAVRGLGYRLDEPQ